MDSPDNNYRIEYFTTSLKDRTTGELRLTRTYHLIDLVNGGATPEHWDTFDLDKQMMLVVNLLAFSGYRIAKVVNGWEASCPSCKNIIRGKIWDSQPKACTIKSPRRCKTVIEGSSIIESLLR